MDRYSRSFRLGPSKLYPPQPSPVTVASPPPEPRTEGPLSKHLPGLQLLQLREVCAKPQHPSGEAREAPGAKQGCNQPQTSHQTSTSPPGNLTRDSKAFQPTSTPYLITPTESTKLLPSPVLLSRFPAGGGCLHSSCSQLTHNLVCTPPGEALSWLEGSQLPSAPH